MVDNAVAKSYTIRCPNAGCRKWFKTSKGLQQHLRSKHYNVSTIPAASNYCTQSPLSTPAATRAFAAVPSETSTFGPVLPMDDRDYFFSPNPFLVPITELQLRFGSPQQTEPVTSSDHPPSLPLLFLCPEPVAVGLGPNSDYNVGNQPEMLSDGFGQDQNSTHNPLPGGTHDNVFEVLVEVEYHPYLTGQICDINGQFLPRDMPPPPDTSEHQAGDWFPFTDRQHFELADFLYRRDQMSAGNINLLMEIWGPDAPLANHKDLYQTIDEIPYDGDVEWGSFTITYEGKAPNGPRPSWMDGQYTVWYRDPLEMVKSLIKNPDFANEFDYAPYHEYHGTNHRFQHFMSGDWAWRQADLISEDLKTHGAMFVPIILGSDKTTVSVGTGDNSYWPLYLSIGNIHNNTRHSCCGGVVLIGFLNDTKTDKQFRHTLAYWKFSQQLTHSALQHILRTLEPGMLTPEIVKCADGHFRKAIFGLGPYIADYPEQCLLASIVSGCISVPSCDPDFSGESDAIIPRTVKHTQAMVQYFELGVLWEQYGLVGDVVPFTEYFPRASIYDSLSPDILHQLIKGVFKDHLVTWIEEYIRKVHPAKEANAIIDDIDHRIAIVPPFTGLRYFPKGRGFKQWTGDDSKALMKVYLPALEGYIPTEMVHALRALLEFCYIVRREVIDTTALTELQDALDHFYLYREIFVMTGIRPRNSVPPCQHSLDHYLYLIRAYGAPNGLCSSITESKHIKAVKEPYRRSSRHQALNQMLTINQRNDKLAAARVHYENLGMLPKNLHSRNKVQDDDDDDDDDDTSNVPQKDPSVTLSTRTTECNVSLAFLSDGISREKLINLLLEYLSSFCKDVTPAKCNEALITTYPSAVATFYAPSDIGGLHGVKKERIRAVKSWRKSGARYDTVFVKDSPSAGTISTGLTIAHVRTFFSFDYKNQRHECVLVEDYAYQGTRADEDSGMWIVKSLTWGRSRALHIIPICQIYRATHLLPIYGNSRKVPESISSANALDSFSMFYVNKYIDHHAFEIAQ